MKITGFLQGDSKGFLMLSLSCEKLQETSEGFAGKKLETLATIVTVPESYAKLEVLFLIAGILRELTATISGMFFLIEHHTLLDVYKKFIKT